MSPLNTWLLNKIGVFLSTKEGCVVDPMKETANGTTIIFQDSFGFRYEMQIKAISRIGDGNVDFETTGSKASGNYFSAISKVF